MLEHSSRTVTLAGRALAAAGLVLSFALAAAAQPPAPAPPAAPPPAIPPATTPPPKPAPPASVPPKDLPAADKLLDKALTAMGGREKIDNIKSTAMKGTVEIPGMGSMTLEIYSMRPDKYLIKQEMPGMGGMRAGSNGEVAWTHNAMSGYELMDAELAKNSEQSDMYRMVFDLKEKNRELTTVDRVEFGGAQTYKVKVVEKDKEKPQENGTAAEGENFAFFNVDDGMIKGMETSQEGPFGPTTVTIVFSEWKEIGEVNVFTKMDIEQMGTAMTLSLTEVEFNKVDPAVFVLPEEVKKLAEEKPTQAPPPAPDAPKPGDPLAPKPAPTPPKPGGGR